MTRKTKEDLATEIEILKSDLGSARKTIKGYEEKVDRLLGEVIEKNDEIDLLKDTIVFLSVNFHKEVRAHFESYKKAGQS